jgi:hypothetical protein
VAACLFGESELESGGDPPDVSPSELESELEEDAALRFRLFFFGGLLSSLESESELALELEVDFALCFDVLGSSSSSSELESESELEVTSDDDVAGFFAWRVFRLLSLSLKVGTELESVSTSDSSLESVSSVDSSSLSTSSAEERVLLESRLEPISFATCCTTLWGVLSLSSLLSSELM